MNSKLKKILKVISSVLGSLIVILALLLVGVRIFGVEVLTILSASMEPKYPTGAIIYVVKTDPATLEVGDVITYQITPSMTATHRIIELVPDEDDPGVTRFRTKGDNNANPDGSLVEYDAVVGKLVFCIPYLGYFVSYIQSPPGSYVAIGSGVVILLFVMIVDSVTNDKKSKKTKEGENPNEKV